MARLRIFTAGEFAAALKGIRFAALRLPPGSLEDALNEPLPEYGLWHILTNLVHAAIDESNWAALRSLLLLFDGVMRAGKRSQMLEGWYVAFMEEIRLPTDPAKLREFWRNSPPEFLAEVERAHRIG